MEKFSWYDAQSVEEALKEVDATVSSAINDSPNKASVIKAGGVDLLDLMKEGLVSPKRLINIRNINGLDQITFDKKTGLRIGSNVTLGEMEENETIKTSYAAVHQAVAHCATPQLRNMASLGGNLAQRTRCWYFRSLDHECFRKGGNMCFAKNGENEYHSIMKNGTCSSVHASSISTALLAFDASIEIAGPDGSRKELKLEEFFVLPGDDPLKENVLKANELITAVIIPPVNKNTKSTYLKQGGRESYDWALADVAVVAEVSGSKAKGVTIALGAAAPIPLKSKKAAEAIEGKSIEEASAKASGEVAVDGATPLAKNGYKVPLFKTLVKRALLEIA